MEQEKWVQKESISEIKQNELDTLIDGLEFAIQDAQSAIETCKDRLNDLKALQSKKEEF